MLLVFLKVARNADGTQLFALDLTPALTGVRMREVGGKADHRRALSRLVQQEAPNHEDAEDEDLHRNEGSSSPAPADVHVEPHGRRQDQGRGEQTTAGHAAPIILRGPIRPTLLPGRATGRGCAYRR